MGVVKEQVGVAFTYLNIHLSAWFLESSGHGCSDNRGSTVISTVILCKLYYSVYKLLTISACVRVTVLICLSVYVCVTYDSGGYADLQC